MPRKKKIAQKDIMKIKVKVDRECDISYIELIRDSDGWWAKIEEDDIEIEEEGKSPIEALTKLLERKDMNIT